MYKNNLRAVRRMLGIEDDPKMRVSQRACDALDKAEEYMGRVSKRREFQFELLALTLALCKAKAEPVEPEKKLSVTEPDGKTEKGD